MKTTDELANEADGDKGKPRFTREERVDEGWTVTPNDGAASDPFEDDEDDRKIGRAALAKRTEAVSFL